MEDCCDERQWEREREGWGGGGEREREREENTLLHKDKI